MKIHQLENVEYRFKGGNKWEFRSDKYTFIMRINAAKADKAASIINGAIKRRAKVISKGNNGANNEVFCIDGMSRFHLNKLETDFNYVPSGKRSNGVLAGFLRQ